MPITADDAVAALVADNARLCSAHPVGRARREKGVASFYTGAPAPTFNGLIVEREDADAEVAAAMLSELAATGVPFNLNVRSDDYIAFVELAASHQLSVRETVPLMVLESAASVIDRAVPEGLEIHELGPEEADGHVEIAAVAFGFPVEIGRYLMTPEVLAVNGTRAYIGEVDGRAVATSIGMTTGDAVGVFNVGTLEEARGRGYGGALTVAAIADGVANGAKWSYLQSSAAGFSVYRRLGFEQLEVWSQYLPASPANG
jgi:GNAT superfamily N-acetyltransferase